MMNIYDKDDGFRQFSLHEANVLLNAIINLTEATVQKLEAIKKELEAQRALGHDAGAEAAFERDSIEILENWAREVVGIGAYPKGYFTVDFKSHIPDTLLCWTYGEQVISHTHKTYETFKDRIPIDDVKMFGFEDSRN